MGRVSLLVEANTSTAIGNISKLGEAIKNAMAKFDSKALTTWETDAETKINKVGETINKLGETLQTFKNNLKADASFGASKALTEFKRKFEDSFQTLSNFKTYFKDGYTFGATTQVDTFKTRINEAKLAVESLNKKVAENANVGANQALKGKRDEIAKMLSYVEALNRKLAVRPVVGAKEAISDFQAGLQNLSRNIGTYLSPMFISLNAVKTQMGELSQVLNSVQQPTWVEPFKTKMQEVVKVLQDIATAYKSVKTEIKQPVGESAARREFQMTDKQAQNLYRTTKMFYRHVRQEFKETRAAATETARAIREAMAAVQGGGGGGGTGGAHGARLGFGEQFFSRMRSNLYSYMTMWFGVGGAIRAANMVLEMHNKLLEQGNELSQTKFDYLGQLRLKAGANSPEYEAMAERVMKKGMEKNAAYQFASFAAMSNISAKEAETIAPYFINNIASASDQKALLSAVAYARANGYSDYSTEQIMAMFLEANKNNPSELAPTANAFVRNLRTNKLFGISLEEQMALVSLGGAEQKDANAATIQRALLSRIYSEGLAPLILGEIEGVGYYKDEVTQKYKFKDAARQAQFEEDMRSGNQVLTVEMIAQIADRMGDQFTKLIGKRLQANLGASFYADISQDPTRFNEIYANMQAIGAGDLSAARSVLASVSKDPSVQTHVAQIQSQNITAQTMEPHANYLMSLTNLQRMYGQKYGYINLTGGLLRAFDDNVEYYLNMQGSAFETQTKRLATVLRDKSLPEEFKQEYTEQYKLFLANYIRERMHGKTFSSEQERRDAFINEMNMLRGSGFLSALPDMVLQFGSLGTSGVLNYGQSADLVTAGVGEYGNIYRLAFGLDNEIKELEPTGTAKAVKAAGSFTYTNKWEEEERARKQAEKDAKAETKAAKAEAKAAKAEAKAEKDKAKAQFDAIPGATLNAPRNLFIAEQLALALTDTSSNMQEIKEASLGSVISNKKSGGNILGQAFYAYASDKTNAATDEQIVEQLVASLNQQGLSNLGIGKLVQAYGGDLLNSAESDENKQIVKKFFEDVKSLLISINDGTAVLKEPITKPAPDRPVPSTARR